MAKRTPVASSRINQIWPKLKSVWKSSSARSTQLMTRFPMVTFFGFLGLLLLLIVVGNWLRKPEVETEHAPLAPKAVESFVLGDTPTIEVQAEVQKSGVITVVAQTGGVVSNLALTEGQSVKAGQRIVSLSSTPGGASAPSLTRQLSERSYQHVLETNPIQKEALQKNRDLANRSNVMSEELRSIGRAAEGDTKALIALNEGIIKNLDEQLAALPATASAAINQINTGKAQVLAGLNGLKASLRASEYSNNEDKDPAAISDISRDATLKQLELQEKALDLSQDIALLNLRLAQVGEALMYPASPCAGTIQRIHVQVGQFVSPGTVIATVQAHQSATTLEALIAGPLAHQISRLEPSQITLGNTQLSLTPRYVSTQPTHGTLHSVLFTLPAGTEDNLTNGQYVTIRLPLGTGVKQGSYIPLDSVYYSQTGAYVYVVDASVSPAQAVIQQIQLGQVFGQMVEVTSGLAPQTRVIVDRSIVEKDPVEVK